MAEISSASSLLLFVRNQLVICLKEKLIIKGNLTALAMILSHNVFIACYYGDIIIYTSLGRISLDFILCPVLLVKDFRHHRFDCWGQGESGNFSWFVCRVFFLILKRDIEAESGSFDLVLVIFRDCNYIALPLA